MVKFGIITIVSITVLAFLYFEFIDKKELSPRDPFQISKNSDKVAESKSLNKKPDNVSAEVKITPLIVEQPKDKINLTNKIPVVLAQAFTASNGHSTLISELSIDDKKLFREVDQDGRKSLKIASLGKIEGEPHQVIGPIRIQTKPNKPIFLRAIDRGVFSNGAPEIFVKADEKGLAQIDFKLGKGMGQYRVLINVAGCGVEQVAFQCKPKESLEVNVSSTEKENNSETESQQEAK